MNGLTYEGLQREMRGRVLRYTFSGGHGGPLLFLWVLGAGALVTLLDAPLFAAAWTGASALFAGLIARDDQGNPQVRERLYRSFLTSRFPVDQLWDTRHQFAIRKGVEVFAEVLAKLADIERARGLDDDVFQAVPDMDRLLALQLESARQAEEFERVLRLIEPDETPSSGNRRTPQQAGGMDDTAALRQRNIQATRNEGAEAHALVGIIGQRLETVMLQVFQMEKRTIDVVTAAETRQGTADAIERLQQSVDARRAAADQLIDFLAPASRVSTG